MLLQGWDKMIALGSLMILKVLLFYIRDQFNQQMPSMKAQKTALNESWSTIYLPKKIKNRRYSSILYLIQLLIIVSTNSKKLKQYTVVTNLLIFFMSILYFASNGHLEICKHMIENGVEICPRNFRGKTPRDLAIRGKHLEVANIFY